MSVADRLYFCLVNTVSVSYLERAYLLAVLAVDAYMHVAVSAKSRYIGIEVHSAVAVVKPEIVVFIAYYSTVLYTRYHSFELIMFRYKRSAFKHTGNLSLRYSVRIKAVLKAERSHFNGWYSAVRKYLDLLNAGTS